MVCSVYCTVFELICDMKDNRVSSPCAAQLSQENCSLCCVCVAESLRAYKQKMKLGQFKDEASKEEIRREEEEIAKHITVGSRCEVRLPGSLVRRGTVKYVGE